MSTDKETLIERLKKSLENANHFLQLKTKIESDIVETLNLIKEITGDAIEFSIYENSEKLKGYRDSQKLVRIIKKTKSIFPTGFVLFGFSVNETTGYPMTVETNMEYFDVGNEDDLKDTIATIIDKYAVEIMKLISEEQDEDIPF